MKIRLLLATLAVAFVTSVLTSTAIAEGLPRRTALDDYIEKPDDSYEWKIESTKSADGMTTIVVDMVSQTWRTKEDVDRPVWRHWLTVSIPDNVTSDVGMLMIAGGYNGQPARSNEKTHAIAKATGTVVAQLGMIPNQRLMFHNDGKMRTEDDLIGYTWDQYLKTGDPTWPARNPMVKGAVRAMDTMTALLASEEGGKHKLDKFVVAGGSKRGWTTWLTGAVDKRVVGIIPIVIDVLNTELSMRHHFACYGFWAPNVGNYVDHKLMQRLDHPRMQSLYELVDPYYYRHRLTMPKLILNGSGDQFFLPDSSKFYWDDLRGENYLRYVPNGDHGLGKTDAPDTIIAFYSLIVAGKKPPTYQWSEDEDGTIRVMSKEQPKEVLLWQAHNPEARDFRVETLGRKYKSTVIEPNGDGLYIAQAPKNEKGWTAYFVELAYDVGAPTLLKMTTNVKVTPDTVPFEGKASNLPTSLTVVCTAPNRLAARKVVKEAASLMTGHKFIKGELTTQIHGKRCYFNWVPANDFRVGAEALTKFLQKKQCSGFAYQLESGSDITLPPDAAD